MFHVTMINSGSDKHEKQRGNPECKESEFARAALLTQGSAEELRHNMRVFFPAARCCRPTKKKKNRKEEEEEQQQPANNCKHLMGLTVLRETPLAPVVPCFYHEMTQAPSKENASHLKICGQKHKHTFRLYKSSFSAKLNMCVFSFTFDQPSDKHPKNGRTI